MHVDDRPTSNRVGIDSFKYIFMSSSTRQLDRR